MNRSSSIELLELAETLSNRCAESSHKLNRWYEENKPAIEKFAQISIEVLNSFSQSYYVMVVTLNRGGWDETPLRNMELSRIAKLIEELLDKTDDEVREALDKEILGYFHENDHVALRAMTSSWKEHFQEGRLCILEGAFRAHTQGDYMLSIPALATQIEGIVREVVQDYERGTKWKTTFLRNCQKDYELYKGKASKTLGASPVEVQKFLALQPFERIQSFPELEELRKAFLLLHISKLFEEKPFSDHDAHSVINRHVICHGIFKKFEQTESLKLFFVLDLLHEAVRIYKEDQSPQTTSATLWR